MSSKIGRHSVVLSALDFPVEMDIKSDLLFSSNEGILDKIDRSIKFIKSINPSSFLVFNYISTTSNSVESVTDGLLALLLTLETCAFESFQFNWILVVAEEGNSGFPFEGWKEAFPFINFISTIIHQNHKIISIPNTLKLAQFGLFQVDSDSGFFDDKFSENSKFIGSIRKDLIEGFIDRESFIKILKFPSIPSKLLGQFNQDSDVIVFKTEVDSFLALLVVDLSNQTLSFIDPVFVRFVNNLFTTAGKPDSKPTSSFSHDWTTTVDENSMDEDSVKKINKMKLKKLILLSLRGIGIKKSDKQFMSVWKHLYCGCIFSLRKELNSIQLDQNDLLKTIKENIKFLNL